MQRNEQLNNTCISIIGKSPEFEKACIRFYNDNGWEFDNRRYNIDNCIGVYYGGCDYWYSYDGCAMQEITLPLEYLPKEERLPVDDEQVENGKIIKITIEYENSKKSLIGDEAIKWMGALDGMCHNLAIRKQNPFDTIKFNWIEE